MPTFPGLVSSGSPISSAWGNGIRNALIDTYAEIYAWAQDVDGNGHDVDNVADISAISANLSEGSYGFPTLHLLSSQGYAQFQDEGILQSWGSYGITGTRIAHNLIHHGGVGDKAITANAGAVVRVGRGDISFYTSASVAAGALATIVEQMTITSTGVGIGTASPSARLDIAGDIRVGSLPSSNPGAGTKKLWYDPADSNRVKYAP